MAVLNDVVVDGRRIHVEDSGSGPVLLLIHGFPGSGQDWDEVVPHLVDRFRVVTLDLPGYGRSDKDPRASYSLFDQADVVEQVVERLGIEHCAVVAHDMGDTVTAELCARQVDGVLSLGLDAVVLTNGSIFIDQAQLTRGQRLTLRLPARPLPFPMPSVILTRSLSESFAPAAPAPEGAIDALIAMIRRGRGDRLLPVLIRYIEERRQHQRRWTDGLVQVDAPVSLVWGVHDPIAVVAMTDRLVGLRPDVRRVLLDDVGHWPSLEAPQRLAREIVAAIDAAP